MTQQPRRRRGVILTPQGKQKLLGAIREFESEHNFGEKYTIEELSGQTGLDPGTVAKVLDAEEGADRRTLDRFFRTFNLELAETDYRRPASAQVEAGEEGVETPQTSEPTVQNRVDWGEAVDVSIFYGRTEELTALRQWIVGDRCRLVALLGMGGIGKTSLAAKLGEQIQGEFEYVVWRSLRNAPLVEDVLVSLIQFLSHQRERNLPQPLDNLIALLMQYLHQHRCLLVLDNVESILRGGERAGQYREGFEGYGVLIRRIGEATHTSCLLLTSREKPKEISLLEGKTRPVRSRQLAGLSQSDGQKILQAEGTFGSEIEQQELLSRYVGNPLAVKIAATTVQELFFGNISDFLEQDATVFGDIRDLLDEQFNRLSESGKATMYWLAINREPVSLTELREDFVPPVTPQRLLETLESLERRSLIEKSLAGFTLQNVVMEYITDRLVEQIIEELRTRELELFNNYALTKATAKTYVREAQVRLILKPVASCLMSADSQLTALLQVVRDQSVLSSGYATGNLLNLLFHLNVDVSGYNFSHLTIRQAHLNGVNLQDVDFANAHFIRSSLTYTFGAVISVSFSPDGKLLGASDSNGDIYLWRVADGHCISRYRGHTNSVHSVTFSPGGQLLASGSEDQTIRLWDLSTQQCLHVFRENISRIWSLAFSPDGQLLASGSEDHTIRLWDLETRQCLHTFRGHTSWVLSVAFSPDGQMLASGGEDQTIRLWDLDSHQCLHTFQGHISRVLSIAFSPDGQILASGSADQTIRLWDLESHQYLDTLQGHISQVLSVAFSPDGQMLASGSADQTVQLWNLKNCQRLHIFQEHINWIRSIAFSPNGQILASSSYDQTIRLWDVKTLQCLHIFQGCSNWVQSVVFSPNGQILASSSYDQTIRLWDVKTLQRLHIFQGCSNWVRSVAFSPDGQMLASGGDDKTIRLWDLNSYQCLQILQGHTSRVWSVTFSPNGKMLASGSEDQSIRLWDTESHQQLYIFQEHANRIPSVAFSPDGLKLASGSDDKTIRLWDLSSYQCLHILQGHSDRVQSVAFSPDGQILASGSDDQTICLWDLNSYKCLHTFQGHINWVMSVAFSPDGQMLASGGDDKTIRIWDLNSYQCLHILQGHSNQVLSVAFSSDGQMLVSGSEDGTIKLWDIHTGTSLKTLRTPRPFEATNITGTTGLTRTQRASLIALGAIDEGA